MMKPDISNKLIKICPVCDYDSLFEPPYDIMGYPSHKICPCCGYEFGFDVSSNGDTFEEYRNMWIAGGFKYVRKKRTIKEGYLEIINKQLTNIDREKFYTPRII